MSEKPESTSSSSPPKVGTPATTLPASSPSAPRPPPVAPHDDKHIVGHQSRASPPRSPKLQQVPTPKPSRSSSPELAKQSTTQPPAQEEAEAEDPPDEIINMETFGQLIELDEDDPEFSRDMVWAYFSQATQTFGDLEGALERQDLVQLSSLGHFLKGSSAALGVSLVQESCEKIQHYGQLRDEDADQDLSEKQALDTIRATLAQLKKEYRDAEKWLRNYYKNYLPDSS